MPDLTRDNERIQAEARRSLAVQREGGFHRRMGTLSIGRGSAELKARHLATKLVQIAIGVAGILVAASVAGAIIGGIGFWGVMLTVLAIAAVTGMVATRKIKAPQLKDINRGDVRQMVSRTELWLEHQRPALPPAAVQVIDRLGAQLDTLGQQLQEVDQAHPTVREIRKLVGEHLPETIESYRRIPAHLRREERGGSTPDQQITDSLGKISQEVDNITRQLAEGSLDDLAIKTRYLEYRYHDGEMEGEKG